jgi:hypothetical protein
MLNCWVPRTLADSATVPWFVHCSWEQAPAFQAQADLPTNFRANKSRLLVWRKTTAQDMDVAYNSSANTVRFAPNVEPVLLVWTGAANKKQEVGKQHLDDTNFPFKANANLPQHVKDQLRMQCFSCPQAEDTEKYKVQTDDGGSVTANPFQKGVAMAEHAVGTLQLCVRNFYSS